MMKISKHRTLLLHAAPVSEDMAAAVLFLGGSKGGCLMEHWRFRGVLGPAECLLLEYL